jgi:hypothetical protein
MKTVHLRRSDPTVDAIVRAAFPDWKAQAVEAHVTDRVHFYGTMWDEGYRRTYVIVRLADLATYRIEQAPFMQRSELHENRYELPQGYVVVVRCEGRCDHTEIHSSAANITPRLPPPADLSDDEQIVLVATCSLKSSYNGESNYRFVEARRHTGITADRYDAAKASLIARKLLNKAGAVTVEGRNARPAWGDAGMGLYGYHRREAIADHTPIP